MTTLIDALKGLEAEMDAYDPGGGRRELDRYEFAAKVCTTEWSEKLSEIIAEHERSAEPVNLFYQPSDSEIQLLLLELNNEAMEYDDVEFGLPVRSNGDSFKDPCSLVELVRQHISNWRESAE